MPLLTSSIPEAVQHIYEPIAMQAIDKMLIDSGIKETFLGNIFIKTDFQNGSVSKDKSHNPRMKSNHLYCKVTPVSDPRDLKFNQATPGHFIGQTTFERDWLTNYLILLDKSTETIISEHMLPTQMNISMDFYFQNYTIAMEFYSRLMTMYVNGDGIYTLPVIYDYPLPKDLSLMLLKIAKLNDVSLEDFVNKLKVDSENTIGVNISRYNTRPTGELIVKRNIYDVPVNVEFAAKPEETGRNERFSKFTLNLVVSFSRPNMLFMKYPIIVNNTFVSEDMLLLQAGTHYVPLSQPSYQSVARNRYFKRFEYRRLRLRRVRLPWYDDWMPPKNSLMMQQKYTDFLIAAFTLDNLENDASNSSSTSTSDSIEEPVPSTIIDLCGDLGGAHLSANVITMMKNVPVDQLMYGGGRFGVELFVNGLQLGPTLWSIDEDLVIRVYINDPKKYYHLVIYEKLNPNSGRTDIFSRGMELWSLDNAEMNLRLGFYENEIEKKKLELQMATDNQLTVDERGYVVDDKVIMEEMLYGRSKDLRICIWDLISAGK